MSKPLSDVQCLLLDMDGTVYLGGKLLPGATEIQQVCKQQGIAVYFVTNNSSQDSAYYSQKLGRLGLDVPPDQILTSGEATAIYVRQHFPGKTVHLVGTGALAADFDAHGITLTVENADLVVLGFDTSLDYDKLYALCNYARAGIPYIATHPDLNCPVEGGFMPDIGATIAFVEAATGRLPDVIVGKPYPPMVEAVIQKTGLQPGHLCMVGDRLYTDIAMGEAGLVTVLVLSGETQRDDLPGTGHRPDLVAENLAQLVHLLRS